MNLDWIHLHLMVNHLPVVLALLGAVASVIALIVKRAGVWRYAAVTMLLAGLLAPVALLSGGQAEDAAEDAWYVSRAAIHDHEEAAEKAMWVTVVAGAVAVVALWKKGPRWRLAMAVVAVVAAGAMIYASFEGGEIVHRSPQLERAPDSRPAS